METFVVIPAYNEERYIQKVLQETKRHASQIIVVDDGSADKTAEIARKEGAEVLRHATNMGKGAALKTGCDYAFRKGAEKVVVMDGDGQHEPSKIPEFLERLKEAEIVFGYRQLSRTMPLVLRFGNWFINKITKFLYGMELKDTQCGYRAFTAEAYRKIRWRSTDYSMESEMIARVGRHKLRYKEVPLKTIYADKYKGTTIIDGVKIVLKMMRWKLFR